MVRKQVLYLVGMVGKFFFNFQNCLLFEQIDPENTIASTIIKVRSLLIEI